MGSVVIPGQSGPAWAGDPAGEGSAWACATETVFIAMSAAANATAAAGRTMRRSRLLIIVSLLSEFLGSVYVHDIATCVIGQLSPPQDGWISARRTGLPSSAERSAAKTTSNVRANSDRLVCGMS